MKKISVSLRKIRLCRIWSVLLGLDGTVVKAHGSSNARAFYSAIRQAKIAGDEQIVKIMRETVGSDNE